ncbi:MAG: tRNA preQ1(34) S-adenosylmethionine ribosyltransferase-isomerase QueA [Terriglobales bacterium]
MRLSDFHYDLPPESIAQEPLLDRANSRLLHLLRASQTWQDQLFRDLPKLLRPTDLVVFNNTRVFPARLYGHRSGHRAHPISPHNPAARAFLRGEIEVLLTKQLSQDPNCNENDWECLVRPGKKIGVGEKLFFGDPSNPHPDSAAELEAEVISRGTYGERRIRFSPVPDFFTRLDRLGHVPLPPYIARADNPADRDRYQTVYAKARGSVAAPTAGLHFTPEILQQIQARGIETAEITLHVGLGTFQPIRVENVEDHKLHRESYEISESAANAISDAKSAGRRIVAIGTTTVRTLEFAARQAGEPRIHPGRGEAEIFIYPGHKFRIVDALLTNFHLPESTLLMLVSALAGTGFVLAAYRHAVQSGYRFYSYGDCMFIE